MRAGHRRAHAWMWTLLAPALAAVLWLAWSARTTPPADAPPAIAALEGEGG